MYKADAAICEERKKIKNCKLHSFVIVDESRCVPVTEGIHISCIRRRPIRWNTLTSHGWLHWRLLLSNSDAGNESTTDCPIRISISAKQRDKSILEMDSTDSSNRLNWPSKYAFPFPWPHVYYMYRLWYRRSQRCLVDTIPRISTKWTAQRHQPIVSSGVMSSSLSANSRI